MLTATEAGHSTPERKQRAIELIIERNGDIEGQLSQALELLRNMEERLIGREPDAETVCDGPCSSDHLSVLRDQQERIRRSCEVIIASLIALQDHI